MPSINWNYIILYRYKKQWNVNMYLNSQTVLKKLKNSVEIQKKIIQVVVLMQLNYKMNKLTLQSFSNTA